MEDTFTDYTRRLTITYGRLLELSKLSIEYPRQPLAEWVRPEEWDDWQATPEPGAEPDQSF